MTTLWGTIPEGERVYHVRGNADGPDVFLISLEVFDSKGRQLDSADIELAMLAVAAGLVAKTNEFKSQARGIKSEGNLLILFADPAICGDFVARTEVMLNTQKIVLESLVRAR